MDSRSRKPDTRTLSRRCRSAGCGEVACQQCGMYALCRIAGLDDGDSRLLERIVARRQPVTKGELLFRAEDPFTKVYAVKAGAFKSTLPMEADQEQVVEFHFPGELLGLEAISRDRYQHTTQALESGSVCAMGFENLDLLGERFAEFQGQLIHQLGGQLAQDRWGAMLARRYTAEERLAGFLVSVGERLAARGFSAEQFRLPMGREDIASYLGLATETVCRLFRRFQADGLLFIRGKHTHLRDPEALRRLSRIHSPPADPAPRSEVEN